MLNASTANNAPVIQYTCTTGANGEWSVDWRGDYRTSAGCVGEYHVINRNSGKCLTVTNAGTTNGSTLLQFACNTGENQLRAL